MSSPHEPPEDRARYAAAEQGAKVRRVALWGDRNPVPPWEWRHTKKASMRP